MIGNLKENEGNIVVYGIWDNIDCFGAIYFDNTFKSAPYDDWNLATTTDTVTEL